MASKLVEGWTVIDVRDRICSVLEKHEHDAVADAAMIDDANPSLAPHRVAHLVELDLANPACLRAIAEEANRLRDTIPTGTDLLTFHLSRLGCTLRDVAHALDLRAKEPTP